MESYDWLIRGGRVIDPANQLDGEYDVAIRDGQIAALARRLDPTKARQCYDATAKLVVPGLIDLHVHVYDQATPLGISADQYCLGRGVTTAVDAGSAGSCNLAGFRRFIVPSARTRLLAFLNISSAGMSFAALGGDTSTAGELESLKLVDVPACVDAVESHRDLIVGIKVRLSDTLSDSGRNELESYHRSLQAAGSVRLPLMVHHTFSSVPLELCPGLMRPGDLYTHLYHGFRSTIVQSGTMEVDSSVLRARERGVLFDVGHGQGSFSWTVSEIAFRSGFWPDTISTDLHVGSCDGPAYDMPTVMSRLLHLGMPLNEVIRRATIAPAQAIGWEDRIGTLGQGREADIAVLSLEEVELDLEDCQSQLRPVRRMLTAEAVWRAGVTYPVTRPALLPNPDRVAAQRRWWHQLEVRDPQ
ncbi:MAG: amidohydrolase/deacetylase family metallohydrolase [Acidobacteriota bacterium]